MGWTLLGGGPVGEVYDGLQDDYNPILYKTGPSADPNLTGDVFMFTPARTWQKVGNPGAMFGVNGTALCGLTSNKDAIYAKVWYAPPLRSAWDLVGGPANTIIAGDGNVLLYTKQDSGDLYMFPDDRKIGGPGYMFAVSAARDLPIYNDHDIYGVTPNRMQIWRYLEPMLWEHLTPRNEFQVSETVRNGFRTRIQSIVAGARALYAVVETHYLQAVASSTIWRYEGSGNWIQIASGQGLSQLAIQWPIPAVSSGSTIDIAYSFNPVDRKLRRYTGSNWQVVNPPASLGALGVWGIDRIFSGYRRILVLANDDLWQYSS